MKCRVNLHQSRTFQSHSNWINNLGHWKGRTKARNQLLILRARILGGQSSSLAYFVGLPLSALLIIHRFMQGWMPEKTLVSLCPGAPAPSYQSHCWWTGVGGNHIHTGREKDLRKHQGENYVHTPSKQIVCSREMVSGRKGNKDHFPVLTDH